MSEKPKVRCEACERRRQELKIAALRVWRKAQAATKIKRKR